MKKIKNFLLIILFINILIISFFPDNIIAQSTSDVNFSFVNDIIFNSNDLNDNGTFNLRNPTDFTETYNASYSFTNEINGTSGTNITFIDIATLGVDTTAQIINEVDGHKKILESYDNDGTATVLVQNDFTSNQTVGTIELWIRSSNTGLRSDILLQDDILTIGVQISIAGNTADKLQYYDGVWNNIQNIVDNIWYHIRIDFDSNTDTFDCYVNGDKLVISGNFRNILNYISNIRLQTSIANSGYYVYYDSIGYSWLSNYSIGKNLVPTIEIDSTILEVDKFAFAIQDTNTQYPVGVSNPSGWSDIETGGGDKVKIFFGEQPDRTIRMSDNTNGAIRGIKRENFDITTEGFINVSIKIQFRDFSASTSATRFFIKSSDSSKILDVRIILSTGVLEWFDFPSMNWITLRNDIVINNIYDFSFFIDYNIDSVVFDYGFNDTLIERYHIPLFPLNKVGLSSINIQTEFITAQTVSWFIYNVGVYFEGKSISDDLGYYILPFDTPEFWSTNENNLYTINAIGNFSTFVVGGTTYIIGEAGALLDDFKQHTNTSDFLNLYELAETRIFPLLIFTLNGSNLVINSINIEGVQLHNDLTGSFAWLQFESGNIDISESFFSVNTLNRLSFGLTTNDTDLEFIKARFSISSLSLSSDGRFISYISQINDLAKGQISILFPSSSNSFPLSLLESRTRVLLTQNQSIQWIEVLISDNDIDSILGTTNGYLFSIQLTFTINIGISIISLNLLEMMVPLLLVIIPTLILSSKLGKQFIVPLFLTFSLIITIVNIIPIWLFFVISVGSMVYLLIDKKEVQ